jgi:CHAT domain-containing protein/tetratricopeptide (TPR) repeat protein
MPLNSMPSYRTFIIVSVYAVLALLPPTTLQRDGKLIDRYKLGDIPLYIMPLDEAAELLSQRRFQSCSDTQLPLWNLQFQMWERGERENVRYLFREALLAGMLIKKAFNSDANLRLNEILMEDEEKNHYWNTIAKHQTECRMRIHEHGDRSPEIGKILEADILELERVGLEKWMIGCCELAADYFFSVQEDEKAFGYLEQGYVYSLANRNNIMASHLAGRVGKYLERTGDYDAAEKTYSECLEFAHIMGDHYAIARALSFMASLRRNQGRYIEAESLYLQSIEHCGFLEDPVCEASRLHSMAELHYSFCYLDRAAYLTQRAILVAERALGETAMRKNALKRHSLEFYLSGSLSLLARLQQRNRDTEEATRTIKRALDIAEDFADRYYYAGLEKLTGDIYLASGDYSKASSHYEGALKTVRKLKKQDREAEYLTSMADTRIRQGKFREAEVILREVEETIRSEGSWKVRLEIERLRGKSAAAREHLEEAVAHYEKAVAIFDNASSNISYEENKHSLAEKMSLLYSRILQLQNDRFDSSDSLLFWAEKSVHRPSGGVSDSPRQLRETIENCITDRQWIPENTLVIRYIVTEEYLIGIGLGRDGSVHHATSMHPDEMEKRVRKFFELCNPQDNSYHPGKTRPEDASEELYRLLIEPFSASLSDKEIVCFIPSESLDKLPFAALYGPDKQFFGEQIRIVTAPSLLHLFLASGSRTVAMGKGTFSSPLLVGAPELTPGIRRLFPNLMDLPYAAREIDQIELLLGGGTRLTGKEASARSLLENARHSDLIHIATHTVQFPPYSGEKAFILSPPEEGSSFVESSLLFEDSIRRLDLGGTRLVVLSACESAPGEGAGVGTGPGLAGAFFKAGAGSVIATIWPIEDRSASIIMSAVYQEILGGVGDAAEALTIVQRRIIAEDRASGNPLQRLHIWAPYIVLSSLEPQP